MLGSRHLRSRVSRHRRLRKMAENYSGSAGDMYVGILELALIALNSGRLLSIHRISSEVSDDEQQQQQTGSKYISSTLN